MPGQREPTPLLLLVWRVGGPLLGSTQQRHQGAWPQASATRWTGRHRPVPTLLRSCRDPHAGLGRWLHLHTVSPRPPPCHQARSAALPQRQPSDAGVYICACRNLHHANTSRAELLVTGEFLDPCPQHCLSWARLALQTQAAGAFVSQRGTSGFLAEGWPRKIWEEMMVSTW